MICFSFNTYFPIAANSSIYFVKTSAKSQWLDSAATRVSKIQSVNESSKVFPVQVTSFEGFYKREYQIRGEGFVVFENGDWIYFVTHSSHENEEVGDITLGKDNQGNFYLNEGHICGGSISFYTSDSTLTLNSYTFFNNFFSDSDNKVWSRILKH